MTETATPRRKRRETPTVDVSKTLATGEVALQTFLAQLNDIARTRQYQLIGRLSRLQILRPEGVKVLDFRKDGPVLGFADNSEQLIVTDSWRGIPPKWDDSDAFCTSCQSACDVCGGTGKKLCEAFKCGGSGRVPIPAVNCPADDCLGAVGETVANPHCKMCRGTGVYIGSKECVVCKGSGRAACSQCRGTGKRPTGIVGGSTNYREPNCSACNGSKRSHKEIPQDINSFVNAHIGVNLALGPIVRFAVESVGGEGTPPVVYDVSEDSNGQHLVLLLESNTPGARVYMIGGVLQARTR